MRILLDECVTHKLKRYLGGHHVSTVQEEGWAGKKNGELLSLVEGRFEVFLTIDQNLRYQQHLLQFRLVVIVVKVERNRIQHFQRHLAQIIECIETAQPPNVILIGN